MHICIRCTQPSGVLAKAESDDEDDDPMDVNEQPLDLVNSQLASAISNLHQQTM
jgi:hypothetical protein